MISNRTRRIRELGLCETMVTSCPYKATRIVSPRKMPTSSSRFCERHSEPFRTLRARLSWHVGRIR